MSCHIFYAENFAKYMPIHYMPQKDHNMHAKNADILLAKFTRKLSQIFPFFLLF